jgi:hypothetical protein
MIVSTAEFILRLMSAGPPLGRGERGGGPELQRKIKFSGQKIEKMGGKYKK